VVEPPDKLAVVLVVIVGRLLAVVIRFPAVSVRAVVPVRDRFPPVSVVSFALLMISEAIDLAAGISLLVLAAKAES